MKQQKIIKVRGSGFQGMIDESNLKDHLANGWVIISTSTHSGGYSPTKTCCLGSCFLPLALLGKEADTTTYVLEKDITADITTKETKEIVHKEEIKKVIKPEQAKKENKVNAWVVLGIFITTIVFAILLGVWGLLIGIAAIIVYFLNADKIEKFIIKNKKKERKTQMKCKNCGQESSQEGVCIHCGENPKEQGKAIKEKGKEFAGSKTKNCLNCGEQNKPENTKCEKCGGKLQEPFNFKKKKCCVPLIIILAAIVLLFVIIGIATSGTPTLNSIKSPVHTEKINIGGTGAFGKAKIKLFINSKETGEVEADNNGKFIFNDVALSEGENKIKVSATKDNKTKTSDEIKVIYAKTAVIATPTPTPATPTPTPTPTKQPDVPAEYKSALNKATSYANTMHMSKQSVYDQLVSDYGEQFSAAAAQYAIDNVKADWNANALAKAKSYQETMSMSPSAIHDQLTSQYGEKFTQAEADYAIQHLND